MSGRFACLLLMAALAALHGSLGCAGTDSGGSAACDPLQAQQTPIALAEVLGVGKHASGTLFVIDRDEKLGLRLFISEGKALVRHEVTGSGEGTEPGGITRLSLLSMRADEPLRVLLERSGSQTRMLLVEGTRAAADRELDISRVDGEALEVVGASALAGLSVQNLPGTFRVEYSARIEGGERLVVVAPEHDAEYADYRLFFGPPDRLAERKVANFSRGRDGGSTTIEFDVDGRTAKVFFPNRIQPDGSILREPVTFELAGQARQITRLPNEAPEVDALSFECDAG